MQVMGARDFPERGGSKLFIQPGKGKCSEGEVGQHAGFGFVPLLLGCYTCFLGGYEVVFGKELNVLIVQRRVEARVEFVEHKDNLSAH